MPKKHRSKKMRGGWDWPWGKKEESTYGSSDGSGSGMWDSFTKSVGSITDSASSMVSSSPSTSTTPNSTTNTYQPPVSGGKRRRKSHRMRGGYSDNVSMTNLASRAASFSGATARAQAYVGGKRTRRRHHKKSHRRHHRK
jgi:hypothetical protein